MRGNGFAEAKILNFWPTTSDLSSKKWRKTMNDSNTYTSWAWPRYRQQCARDQQGMVSWPLRRLLRRPQRLSSWDE